jgi:hypothetical protein
MVATPVITGTWEARGLKFKTSPSRKLVRIHLKNKRQTKG